MAVRVGLAVTEEWETNIALLFARYPVCFGNDASANLPEQLDSVGPDPRLLVNVAWHLWKNGMELARISHHKRRDTSASVC